ncbi:MAG: hypothetical protein ING33_03250 [Rhodocyclaceae bacterium]|nr:hypothetical protein [Rhodocyclaceae bacterium]
MTNATMALAELAEKGPDVDMLRQMVQFAAQRLMDMEAETLCGAGHSSSSSPWEFPFPWAHSWAMCA